MYKAKEAPTSAGSLGLFVSWSVSEKNLVDHDNGEQNEYKYRSFVRAVVPMIGLYVHILTPFNVSPAVFIIRK